MPSKEVGESGQTASTDRLLGELIAEIRALKHSENNTSSKVDAVSRQTAPIPALVQQVKEIKDAQDKHHFRIAVLEADKNRREGAIGLVEWVARHWPIAAIAAAMTFIWALVQGK
jgi:hypothetical protein